MNSDFFEVASYNIIMPVFDKGQGRQIRSVAISWLGLLDGQDNVGFLCIILFSNWFWELGQ